MATINANICIRRDTAANWTSNNPTLLVGEMCYETDTGKFKVGTGTTWTSTSYSASGTSTITAPGLGAVTRTVSDKLAEWVSVKDFGAVGDGTTDDRAAIQTALNSCMAEGKTLFFPKGTYAMSSFSLPGAAIQIDIVGPVGPINMVGDRATIKTTVATHASYMLYVRGAEGKDINLEGLTFDANYKSQTCFRHDERQQSVTNVTINNCTFKNGLGLASAGPAPLLWRSSTGLELIGGYKFINVTNSTFVDFKREVTPTDSFETTGMAVGINTEGPGGVPLVTFPQNTNVSGCYFNDINNNQTGNVAQNCNADGLKIFGGNVAGSTYTPSTATVTNNHFINCQGRAIKIQNDESVVTNNTVRYAVRPIQGGSGQINCQLECGIISNNIFHYDVAPSIAGVPQNPFANALGGVGSAPLGFYSGSATTRARMYTVSDNIVLNNVPEATGVMSSFTGWSEQTATALPVFITISGNKISGPMKIFALATTRNTGGMCTAVIKDNMMAKLTHALLATSASDGFALNRFEVSGNVNAFATPVPHLVSTSDYTTELNGNFNASRNQNIGTYPNNVQNIQGKGFITRSSTITDAAAPYSASVNIQTITAVVGSEVVFPKTGFHWSNSGLRILVGDNGGSTNFIFMKNDDSFSSISAGSNIAFVTGGGACRDPGTASKVNVYTTNNFPDNQIRIFNRTATQIVFTLFSFA